MSDEQTQQAESPAEPAPATDAQAAAERIMAAQAQAAGRDDVDGIEGAVGTGVDIVNIERMRQVMENTEGYTESVFTAAERAYCTATTTPHVHLSMYYAAKQAVIKALGESHGLGIAPIEIEVCRNAKGRPYVRLSGNAQKAAREVGVREIPVSLTHTHTDAVACAMSITEDSVRATERRVNPLEELSRQFKETRSLLDDIPAKGPSL